MVADLDDQAAIRAAATRHKFGHVWRGRYELTGVFANPSLTHWNFFEEQDARVREKRRVTESRAGK